MLLFDINFEKSQKNDFKDVFITKFIASGKEYESRRWPFIIMSPIMYIIAFFSIIKCIFWKVFFQKMPKYSSFFWAPPFFPNCSRIRETWGRWESLDIVYNFIDKYLPSRSWYNFSFLWLQWIMINPAAVRNRRKLAFTELLRRLRELAINGYNREEGINVLSVACGTSEAFLRAVAVMIKYGVKINIHLLDYDKVALQKSYNIACELGISECVYRYHNKANDVEKLFRDGFFHIIEVIGYYDYLDVDKSKKTTLVFRPKIRDHGFLAFANIAPNPEKFFMDYTVNWPMKYKTADQLISIAKDTGFKEIFLATEPLLIHNVVFCKY